MLTVVETAREYNSIGSPSIAWRKLAIRPYAGFKIQGEQIAQPHADLRAGLQFMHGVANIQN